MAVLAFLGSAGAVARLVAGPGWFALLTGAGLAAAAACAAGPAVALHRARPGGPALAIAVVAGSCATTLMAVATVASLADELAQPHQRLSVPLLTAYALVMAAALLTATTSCARGLRAAWPSAPGGGSAR